MNIICDCLCVRVRIFFSACVCVRSYEYVRACVYGYVRVCVPACVSVYVCECVCVRVCGCVCEGVHVFWWIWREGKTGLCSHAKFSVVFAECLPRVHNDY